MTLEEVLRTNNSIKGHHTRCEKEITNLLGLAWTAWTQYSSRDNDRLEKLEK